MLGSVGLRPSRVCKGKIGESVRRQGTERHEEIGERNRRDRHHGATRKRTHWQGEYPFKCKYKHVK